jgi:hypothetical protein
VSDVEFGEIVAQTVDGKPVIVDAPLYARISWGLLEMCPGWSYITFVDGLIVLADQVTYRIVGAQNYYAEVERVD